MRQSEFKKRYDIKTGRYVKKHIYGEGVTDVFKTIGRKLFGACHSLALLSLRKNGGLLVV